MRLHYKSAGQGTPLVVLHGLFGSLDNWSGTLRALAPEYHVFVPDQRNHGRSPHSPTMSYEEMAEDIRELLGICRLHRVHLLGHSMGGKVAMRFAQLHPERLLRLIVVDIAPKSYPPEHRTILDTMLGLDLRSFSQLSQIEEAMRARIPDVSVRRFLMKSLERNEAGEFRWRIGLEYLSRNYDRLIQGLPLHPAYQGMTLFVRGEHSNYVVPNNESLLHQIFPHAETRTISGAGHWVHWDKPGQFLNTILHFMHSDDNPQVKGPEHSPRQREVVTGVVGGRFSRITTASVTNATPSS